LPPSATYGPTCWRKRNPWHAPSNVFVKSVA